MYQQLATRLVLDTDAVTKEYSPAVSLEGFNAAQIEVVLLRLTATDVGVTIQLANDRENWRDLSGSTETISKEGYAFGTKRTGLGTTYLRLKYTITGSTGQIGILAAGVNLSEQD